MRAPLPFCPGWAPTAFATSSRFFVKQPKVGCWPTAQCGTCRTTPSVSGSTQQFRELVYFTYARDILKALRKAVVMHMMYPPKKLPPADPPSDTRRR